MKLIGFKALVRDALFFFGIMALAFLLGIGVNQFRNKPLPLVYLNKAQRLNAVVSEIQGGVSDPRPFSSAPLLPAVLSNEMFRDFVRQHVGIVLDARPEIFHRLSHVPGALSLPRDDFAASYTKLREQLQRNKNQPLVTYCAEASCEDSELVRQALIKLGYTNVGVFRGGWEEWTRLGMPQERAQ